MAPIAGLVEDRYVYSGPQSTLDPVHMSMDKYMHMSVHMSIHMSIHVFMHMSRHTLYTHGSMQSLYA